MALTKVLLVTLGFFAYSYAKVEPKVKCTPELMQVEIPITPQTKNVYLEELRDYPEPACKPQVNPDRSVYTLELNLTNVYQCGITRVISQLTGKRVYYKTIIVETTDNVVGSPQLRTEEIQVKCSISPVRNHTVNKRNVLPAGFQELEDFDSIESVIKHAPVPTLGVGVRQSGKLVTGELNVSPGTPLQMEIYLDKNSSAIYGLLVTHMQVTDTKSQEETIIYNGCSIDPYLFENFNTVDGDFLSAKFRAFKFPESTYVQFKGTVNVCLDKCNGSICSDGQVGYGRKRRSLPTLPADPNKIFEITITSFIKVNYDEESENFEEMIKTQEKAFNNKKFIVGSEMDKKMYKTIDEMPSNLGIATLVEEEHASSVFADNAAFSIKSPIVAVLIVGLLHIYL